jgi:hypothetical protein
MASCRSHLCDALLYLIRAQTTVSRLEGQRKIAIVMNAPTFSSADDIDYFITNVDPSIVTHEWVVNTYSQRNWVEVLNQ